MGYETIEAGAATLLRALSRFADGDVTRGDFRVLDTGKNTHYVVLLPGPFEGADDGDYGQKRHVWTMYVKVFERYTGDGSEWTNLIATRQDVIDTFSANPTMGGVDGVTKVSIGRGGQVTSIYERGNPETPQFLQQQFEVRIWEKENYAGSGEFS